MSDYQFSNAWFDNNVTSWEKIRDYQQWYGSQPLTVVEVGCFEGKATCWMLNHILLHPESRIHCVDTFEGSEEHSPEERQNLYQRFLHNIHLTNQASRVNVRVGRSDDCLVDLIKEKVQADLIYIDGSHRAQDVLTDAVLAWKLLKVGGIMVFDDYLWRLPQNPNNIHSSPKLAIDNFINVFSQNMIFLGPLSNYQFYIQRV